LKNLILASTSTVHGGEYLDYLKPTLISHFEGVKRLTFIPFARPGGISHELYTSKARTFFKNLGIEVLGLHEFRDPIKAIAQAEAVFTGGGNTFLLVEQLYQQKIMAILRDRLYENMPYLGTSAGSNIAGISMQTTNDMPIVYPPSFKTLGAMPFNINAHYLDPDPGSTHMGETRETRIKEFHQFNNVPVVGLREGSWIEAYKRVYTLRGPHSARIFEAGKIPYELDSGSLITIS
tara:strand:- start:159 stop:863 length:705 start_codon:yes stop_codon:yes gene_type:complete